MDEEFYDYADGYNIITAEEQRFQQEEIEAMEQMYYFEEQILPTLSKEEQEEYKQFISKNNSEK